ncbi:MAG: ShlB/FhaC/HecB family hemolysin secretion/activation protein [Candidatus Omnitrophica bacterium]|nr:ShlB/FhaC/HecB family hemolysin secretion/activation protein [Candidatus Omnitrophota bacterium]
MKLKKTTAVAVLVSFLLIQSQAFADVPAGTDAGSENKKFTEEFSQNPPAPSAEKKEQPVEKPEAPAPQGNGARFRMNSIRIVGNEAISTDELNKIVSQLLNRDVNIEEIQEVITEIKKHYRSKGYVATYVSVPPQRIQEGVVELRVVEGKLGKIEITGNKWFSTKILNNKIQIEPGVVIKYDDLQSSLARLNENKDVRAKAVLKPGATPETTDIQIQVNDKLPVHLTGDVNNLGTDNTGKTRWGIQAVDTNLLGRMDQLSARVQLGRQAFSVGADYYMPLNSYDTRLGFSYQRSSVKVGGPFRALDIKGHASTYSPYLSQPIFDNKNWKVGARTSLDIKEIENEVLGQVSSKDRLRVWDLSLNIEETDKWGKSFFPQSFDFGFADFMGSSPKGNENAARTNTGGQYFIQRGSYIRYTRLPKNMMLALRSSVQMTPDRLPSAEQFRIGGAYTVRGYPEGDFVSDYGGTLSTEMYIPSYIFPKDWKLPFSKEPLRQQVQATTFFDFGAGANRHPTPGEHNNRTLAGFGAGVRVHLFDKVYARAEWAKPVANNPSNDDQSAFYYGVSVEFM